MAKVADSYFKVHPWLVQEEGFNPEYGEVAESVFSQANEYMGVRGYFEEGYSGKHLLGSYFNGVYERRKAEAQGYKGIVQETEFMVNAVDWLYLRIEAEGEKLDLATAKFRDFSRTLDFRNGLLTREFVWQTAKGEIKLCFERLLSMKETEIGAQRLTVTALDFNGEINVEAGLNFDTVHGGDKLKLWHCPEKEATTSDCFLKGITEVTGITVDSCCTLSGTLADRAKAIPYTGEKIATVRYTFSLKAGENATLEKIVRNKTPMAEKADKAGAKGLPVDKTFDSLLADNEAFWSEVWEKSDIEIQGDEENQQGIRFCIFQMFQTYHGAVRGTNIGAKGLTGEAYNGNAFWDTETYCLPFFLFHDRKAAENLLYFRYATLPEAQKRAEALDCKGAFYPIATISGSECCNLWQHASLQLQASTAVAYGIWLYEKVTGDTAFTEEYGLTMLIEVCRMLATRGAYNAAGTHYGFYGVMGPDEFQMMVNHNCYTNYMGKFALDFCLEVLDRTEKQNPARLKEILEAEGFNEAERADFAAKAKAMYIPYSEDTKLFEQHQGYFDLPHIDVDAIPVEEFPLYHHWTYDRIYRNDMIKQPDVLMFLLLFNSSFDLETIRANYEFYEPRCIHESSLSPSVHSILAAQLGREVEAYDFFRFATRMDLDNYNRNSGEGIHTTSISAAWMNIVYGFGGLRCDGATIALAPVIPEKWEGYSFRIVWREEVIQVAVSREDVRLKTLGGTTCKLALYGKETEIGGQETVVPIKRAEA